MELSPIVLIVLAVTTALAGPLTLLVAYRFGLVGGTTREVLGLQLELERKRIAVEEAKIAVEMKRAEIGQEEIKLRQEKQKLEHDMRIAAAAMNQRMNGQRPMINPQRGLGG